MFFNLEQNVSTNEPKKRFNENANIEFELHYELKRRRLMHNFISRTDCHINARQE